MKKCVPAAAFLTVALTGLVAAGNDSFSQRRILPSQETVEEAILQTAEISYEALDPLSHQDFTPDNIVRQGTLWWEWTAPRDGWFSAGSMMANALLETYVTTGDSLERLMPVQNGNRLGLKQNGTIFEARQGIRYNIMVRIQAMPVTPDPAQPVVAWLRLKPAPGVPVNNTLETRRVLTGTLPLTVKSTNLTVPSQEGYLFQNMAVLDGSGNMPYSIGATQWFEWTCQETGRHMVDVADLGASVFGAARAKLAGGATAPAGQWDIQEMEVEGKSFYATAGTTYDIAVMSQPSWDYNSTDIFGEYSVTLSRVVPPAEPLNTTRETALAMPSTLDSTGVLFWKGRPGAPQDALVSFWWKFTAPSTGMYSFSAAAGEYSMHYEPGRQHSEYHVPLLEEGEVVHIECIVREKETKDIFVRIEHKGVPVANDMIAQAADLGTARDFHLFGHGSTATLEPGEEVPVVPYIPSQARAGSLWWKWTAPEEGWLRKLDAALPVTLTFFKNAPLTGPRSTLSSMMEVQAGDVFFIRAGVSNRLASEACAMHLDFLAKNTNLTWQTARDLGITRAPAWNPPYRLPEAVLPARQWFRWTAAETGDLSLPPEEDFGEVYVNPSVGLMVLLNPASRSYHVEAGQTYWLRTSSYLTSAWFELMPVGVTSNGDPSTAITISSEIPAAAAAFIRGDVNSELEIEALQGFSGEEPLRNGMPAIWWKWQSQSTQRVRVHVESFHQGGIATVFSGAVPVADVDYQNGSRDWGGLYFNAEAGKTYWVAYVGDTGAALTSGMFRAEIWPVTEIAPPNDNFSTSRRIHDFQWEQGTWLAAVHHGNPGGSSPLRWEWTKATLEVQEPPVESFEDTKGNLAFQTASTWWNWTAPSAGIFEFRVTTRIDGMRTPRGGSDPFTPKDLSGSVFTGDSLSGLQPVMMYEPVTGIYCFRAQQGVRYTIRVASGDSLQYYELYTIHPPVEHLYDFAAMEDLRFEDVGNAWGDDAGDGIANVYKFLFGLDPAVPVDHPRNAAKLSRLPRIVPGAPGTLEMRCRPDPDVIPEGNAAAFIPRGEASQDLVAWEELTPFNLPGGEVAIRYPADTPSGFLRWRVLRNN